MKDIASVGVGGCNTHASFASIQPPPTPARREIADATTALGDALSDAAGRLDILQECLSPGLRAEAPSGCSAANETQPSDASVLALMLRHYVTGVEALATRIAVITARACSRSPACQPGRRHGAAFCGGAAMRGSGSA